MMSCDTSTSPGYVQWYVGFSHVPSWDNRYAVSFGCRGGYNTRVDVYVSDSSGTTVKGGYFRCFDDDWQ